MSRVVDKLMARYYSEPRFDGTTQFYDWVRSLARPEHRVLNLGAGPATKQPIRILKGEVTEIVGADIDPVVLVNEEIDRGILIDDYRLEVPDGYFDLAYSDYVLEHVEHPDRFLAEVCRVLKPGASYLFRTPNKHHYVALVSGWTPHWFHRRVANPVRKLDEEAHEPWPTYYRMNTRSRLRSLARSAGLAELELRMIECEPSYLQFHIVPFLAGMAYERMVNSTDRMAGLRVNILGRMRKPG